MGDQGKPRRIRRAAALAAVMALTSTLAAQALEGGGLLAPILAPVTGGPAAAVAPLSAPAGGYAAFATGTVLHAGIGGAVGGMIDLVSSTAAATSAASTAPVNSELGRVALPVLPAKGSYGQGLGLGLGVGLLPGLSTGFLGNAVATAPPSSAPVEQEAAPVGVAPLLHLTPLKARAQALSSAAGCVLGSSLASGQGTAADLSLVGLTGLKGITLGSSVTGQPSSRSESRTVVVPGSAPGRLGLMSETTQVLGPIALLAGTSSKMTVELKGQWVLRVSADGKTGQVSYGPEGVPADQALVVVRNAAGQVAAQATASQMKLAGTVGLRLDIPGVGELVVGEQPRARGRTTAPQATGTSADAAVDLVRIRVLGQDVRLGHMEAAVAVPPSGVSCPGLEVTMAPDTASVAPGSGFGVKVKVRNPNEGTVSDLAVASHLTADPGVAAAAAPAGTGNLIAPNGPAFKLSTPLGPGQAVELPARVQVAANSGPGRVRLGATATGRYGDGPLAVPAAGNLTAEGPVVTAPVAPPGEPKISVGTKGKATAGAPTGTGGRKPVRTSAGVTGAAGLAASAAPVTPAPSTPVTPAPAPPVEPTPAPPVEPAPAPATEPGSVPAPPATPRKETAAPPLKKTTDRGRWAWGGAAAVFLAAVAAAAVTRLLGGARR